MPKLKPPTPKEFEQHKIRMALAAVPTIYACKKCGWPVIDGFRCTYCNDSNPSEKPQ
jgi:hypothetical protein